LAGALANGIGAVKLPHSTSFDPQAVRKQLGISMSSWDGFMYWMKTLSERKVTSHEAMNYFLHVFTDSDKTAAGLTHERAMKKVQALYDGQGADIFHRNGVWSFQCGDRVCRSRMPRQERGPSVGIGLVRPRGNSQAKSAGTSRADGSVRAAKIASVFGCSGHNYLTTPSPYLYWDRQLVLGFHERKNIWHL
jgi:hypothetical protein